MTLYEALQPRYLAKVGLNKPPTPSGDLSGIRACGTQHCEVCHQPLKDHPFDFSLMYQNVPVFRLDCAGQRVKL